MEREIKEILASQQKMLQRRNEASKTTDEELEAQFREHLKAIKYWLARQPNMSVLYVDYNRLMADPDAYCQPSGRLPGRSPGRRPHAERPERTAVPEPGRSVPSARPGAPPGGHLAGRLTPGDFGV